MVGLGSLIYFTGPIFALNSDAAAAKNVKLAWRCPNLSNSSSHVMLEIFFISYPSYSLHCCTLPDKRCLSHGKCLYQVMMTLHFLNDVAIETESTQKYKKNTS